MADINNLSLNKWLAFCLGLVLFAYGLFFVFFYQESLVFSDSDAKEYITLGQNIFSYHEFSRNPGVDKPEVFRTPGYPLFVGLTLTVFSSFSVLVWLQIGLVILTVFTIYLIGKASNYPKVGLVAGLLYAFDPTTVANTFFALSDILFVAVFLVGVYILLFRSDLSLLSLGVGGVILGLSVLIRPVGLYVLPIILILWFFFCFPGFKGKQLPATLVIILSLSITFGPWFWRNGLVAGEVKLSSVGEYNLLFYNAALFKAHYLRLSHQEIQDGYRSLFANASPYDYQSFKFSDEYKKLALAEILEVPVSYFTYHLLKTAPFFVGSGLDNYRYFFRLEPVPDVNLSDFFLDHKWREFVEALWSDPVVLAERLIWLIVLILSFILIFFRSGHHLTIVSLSLITWFALLTGPVAMPRYHLPISPFLFLLAGACIAELRYRMKTV